MKCQPKWVPAPSGSLGTALWRNFVSLPCYPIVLPYIIFSRCDLTYANCKWWRGAFACIGIVGGVVLHAWAWWTWSSPTPLCYKSVWSHLAIFFTFDHPQIWLTFIAHQMMKILSVDRRGNRLIAGKLHGPRVIVI